MASPPESTKTSLRQHLLARARERWPQLTTVGVRHHGAFAYVTGELADGTTLPLFRLRYNGSTSRWGFAIYRASHEDYQDSILPSGYPFGTSQEALDCACGLYLNDTTGSRVHHSGVPVGELFRRSHVMLRGERRFVPWAVCRVNH